MGTVSNPRHIIYSPNIRQGQVYTDQDLLYVAKVTGDAEKNDFSFPVNEHENEAWREILPGAFRLPWDNHTSILMTEGDFYKNENKIYRVKCDTWSSQESQISSCLELVKQKDEWMALLRPEIGDKRLGDIVFPATHDSGTYGCSENSTLVDKNFLYQLGSLVTPETLLNWSKTQDSDLGDQLHQGFREYDLRVADLIEETGLFHWWHGISADPILEGLEQIARFVEKNSEEVVVLSFGHFAAPGNTISGTTEISDERKDELSDIFLDILGDLMAPQSQLSDNPTMNEVLATGCNIIAIMSDSYIRDKDDRYWSSVIHGGWSGRTNPEDLFVERSSKLKDWKENYADRMTDVTGCITPDEKTVTGSLLRVYGDDDEVLDILEELFPELVHSDPDMMSFEGLYLDLLTLAGEGTNTGGMWERVPQYYSNAGSTHYWGNGAMQRYWLARPDVYKNNFFSTDDSERSILVDLAIQGNLGEIPREVSVSHQGTTTHGYYYWEGFEALGGNDAYKCTAIKLRYSVISESCGTQQALTDIETLTTVDFAEGQFCQDADVLLEVSSEGSEWLDLYFNNIQDMIDNHMDVYVRGTDLENGTGFAYVSQEYDDFTESCDNPPQGNDQLVNI